MKALVLAAGLGTRLRPITERIAKPALPIVGIPSLWFGAWWIHQKLKLEGIAINCSYLAQTVIDAARNPMLKAATGIDFYISDESDLLLGTSGALKKLSSWVGTSPLAVINADSIFLPDWVNLLRCHQKSKAKVTLYLRPFKDSAEPYTHIEVDEYNRVLEFDDRRKSGLMFAGAYIIEPDVITALPQGPSDLMNTVLKPLAQRRELFCFMDSTFSWFDTGTIKTYVNTNFAVINALPAAHDLIKTVMKDLGQCIWVPKSVDTHNIKAKLRGPIIVGSEAVDVLYEKNLILGPQLIAISSPKKSMSGTYSHCVMIDDDIYPTDCP